MPDPSKLAYSSVFDSFKNNDYTTSSLTISGTIVAGAIATFSGTATLDRAESVTQIYFSTSVNSDYHSVNRNYLYTSDTLTQHSNGSTPTLPGTAAYSTFFTVEFSGTTITLSANIQNPYADTLTPIVETIDFEIYTFVAPFN